MNILNDIRIQTDLFKGCVTSAGYGWPVVARESVTREGGGGGIFSSSGAGLGQLGEDDDDDDDLE